MERVAVFIDGGYLKKIDSQKRRLDYKKLIQNLMTPSQELWRAYYYDCPPYRSQSPTQAEQDRYNKAMAFFGHLEKIPRMVVRQGKLKNRGHDQNGQPIFVQKRVDLQLGIDITAVCLSDRVEMVILLSGDGDMIPAVEKAKEATILVKLAHGPSGSYDQFLWDFADERVLLDDAFLNRCV